MSVVILFTKEKALINFNLCWNRVDMTNSDNDSNDNVGCAFDDGVKVMVLVVIMDEGDGGW